MLVYDEKVLINFWRIANSTAQKMKFFMEDFFSKYDQIQFPVDLVTFTEEILNEKFHFLCSVVIGTGVLQRLVEILK